MQPYLLVGVGGSGGKTLRAIKRNLEKQLIQKGWTQGIPDAWQFLHIDSVATEDGASFPAPFLGQASYLSLGALDYQSLYTSLLKPIAQEARDANARPLPDPANVLINVAAGAGAWRAVGRTLAAANLNTIKTRVAQAVNVMNSGTAAGQLQQIGKLYGEQKEPLPMGVVVFSSIAGGSGAGMYLDVCEAVKAAGAGAEWAKHLSAVLYTPDVFKAIPGPMTFAGNALGATCEYLATSWTQSPTKATRGLYQSQGVNPGLSDEAYRMGPKDAFLVGMSNTSGTDFGSQEGVYQAVGTSFAALLLSLPLHDAFVADTKVNLRSRTVPDEAKLVSDTDNAGRFSALGFSRVALGLERFSEYSSERFAKEMTETILRQHIAQDPGLELKTAEQWVQEFANMYTGKFISDCALFEATEENNQVIDALRPNSADIRAKFKASVQGFAESAVSATGLPFADWVSRISNAYNNGLHAHLGEIKGLRLQKVRAWVQDQPNRVLQVVLNSIADNGLPVTLEMLRRLSTQVKAAQLDLVGEATKHRSDTANIQMLVSQALGGVSSMNAIPANNPAVDQAYEIAANALYWTSEAELKNEAAELLGDFDANYVHPLEAALSAFNASLGASTTAAMLLDGRTNPYDQWPTFANKFVSKKFEPAPNEALLIDVADYPKIFDELVKDTNRDAGVNPFRAVVKEVIMGAYGSDSVANLPSDAKWSLVDILQEWTPLNTEFRISQGAPNQQAAFDFARDHMKFPHFADKWLLMPSRPFEMFIHQDIVKFLNPVDATAKPKHIDAFVKAFDKFSKMAAPLVDIDEAFYTAKLYPGKKIEVSPIVSAIPVDEKDELFQACQNSLMSAGLWEASKSPSWFVGAKPGIDSITIMTAVNHFVNPIAVRSIMEPIASEWTSNSTMQSKRAQFLGKRRARPLAETIPAHPEEWQKMLTGFYVARLFSQFAVKEGDEELGSQVSIWCGSVEGWRNFPYPLMAEHIEGSLKELPGLLLSSMQVALVNCYKEKSMDPLAPYHRLAALGSKPTMFNDWIREGKLPAGAPEPKAERAGTTADNLAIRKEKVLQWLADEAGYFTKIWEESVNDNPRNYPISWEIRDEIDRAIQNCIDWVRQVSEVAERSAD